MKFIVDLELSSQQKALVRRAFVAGAVIAALGVGIALAAPKQFKPGDPLSSADMNANFADLDTRVAALEKRPVLKRFGRSYSLDAVYCNKTAPTAGAFSSGGQLAYGAAKVQCESVCASPTAHMCEAHEMVRTLEMAQGTDASASALPPEGWYSSGLLYVTPGATTAVDCLGWSSSGGANVGPVWNANTTSNPSYGNCNNPFPILCCD